MSQKTRVERIDNVILLLSITFFCTLSAIIYYYAPALKAHFEGDSLRYHEIAHHIMGLKNIPLEVLGYPLMLNLLYHLHNSIALVVIAQALLSILSLLVVRHCIKQLSDNPWAQIWATLFWATNLGFFIYTQLLLIEIILTFLLVLFVDRIIMYYKKESSWYLAQAAAVLGISVLFRPAALFYALFFALLLLFTSFSSFTKKLTHAALFLFIFYLPIIAYMFLNLCYFGYFGLCPVINVNLFKFFYSKLHTAYAAHALCPNELINAIDNDIAHDHITSTTQANLGKLCLQHPGIACGIWLQNMIKSFLGLYQTQWKLYFELSGTATSYFCIPGSWFSCLATYIKTGTTRGWLCLLGWYELLYLLAEYLMMAVGLLVLAIKRQYWLFIFALSFIVYFAFVTGPDGSGRFRMMMEPWLLVLAALGTAWTMTREKKQVAHE